MTTDDVSGLQAKLDGFFDGVREFERQAKEAEAAGDQARANKLRDAIRGAFRGLEKKLDGDFPFWRS